jgi:putative endopeptidase
MDLRGAKMMVRRFSATAGLCLLIFAAILMVFAGRDAKAADDTTVHSFDKANLDRTCKPCEDFFQFAEGGWIKNNPIPPEYPEWGSFVTLQDHNENALHGILEAAANTSAAAGSNEQKIGDFYAACMDTTGIEQQGLKPLEEDFRRIDAIHDTASLLDTGAHLQAEGVGVLFGFASDQDFKDSAKVIGVASQGGL